MVYFSAVAILWALLLLRNNRRMWKYIRDIQKALLDQVRTDSQMLDHCGGKMSDFETRERKGRLEAYERLLNASPGKPVPNAYSDKW